MDLIGLNKLSFSFVHCQATCAALGRACGNRIASYRVFTDALIQGYSNTQLPVSMLQLAWRTPGERGVPVMGVLPMAIASSAV